MDFEQTTETILVSRLDWLGSAHGTDAPQPGTLDVSAFTEATHYPDGFFLPGIPLAKPTAASDGDDPYVPWASGASDGTQTIRGFLYDAPRAPADTTLPVGCAVLKHGSIVLDRLPVAVTAAQLPPQFWTRG